MYCSQNEEDIDLITLPILVFMNLGVGSTSVIADFDPRKPGQMNPDSNLKSVSWITIAHVLFLLLIFCKC
jgi:hypothetical protein